MDCLLIAASETDANIYYASGFLAPDPFIYLQLGEKSYLLMSDLEIDRARLQSRVGAVLSYTEYEERAKRSGLEHPRCIDVVHVLLEEQGVRELKVPGNFPLVHADALRKRGYTLSVKEEPFFNRRAIKTDAEVAAIRKTQIAIEEGMDEMVTMLRASEIKNGFLVLDGEILTSERLRRRLHLLLMEKGCVANHTIIACGTDACDPHQQGTGPVRAHEAIIFDIFPRSTESHYFADMSRTVVKGRASDGLKRLYDVVLQGQEMGIARVKNGVQARDIHEAISKLFEQHGYMTGKTAGRMQGFFHGTGHGVGLDIHEPPRIGSVDCLLQTGEVVTVEPGLYYPDIGAVRIEDMVLVQDEGCRNLTTYPKVLEIS